ncbi:MAG: homoserine dehydrogenase [Desulfobacterales bacterium]
MQTIQIGVLGGGTVGSGVIKILRENRDLLTARTGVDLVLKWVADIDPTRADELGLPSDIFTRDARQVIGDPQVEIVVEMIGGQTIARELILEAMAQGKSVVTANKALLAEQGTELFEAATRQGVDLGYEAAIGGCMPIVKTLREALVGNRIEAMTGIFNGTCNYILSRITDEGIEFGEALAQAQRLGYAEADPFLDVEGRDTAHKLALLGSLAYGMGLNFEDIYIEGISHITPRDIALAGQFGYRIKLLAISKRQGDRVQARVHPTMIPFDNLLSSVNGTLNAVTVRGDAVGEILLHGHGAGMMPTASAVVSDIVDMARNIVHRAPGRIPILGYQPEAIATLDLVPMEEIETHYYFRFAALDRPGVLSAISGLLGEENISIQSVQQTGRKTNGSVPIVMLTHLAREANVRRALGRIDRLEVVSDAPVLIRIEEETSDR